MDRGDTMALDPRIEIVPLDEVPVDDEAQTDHEPTVLIVDDERVITDTLAIILAKNGFAPITAYNGEDALRLAQEHPPDLLLSDVMMGPGIDGTELAMEVVRMHPLCRVLLFSGHSGTRDLLLKSLQAGHCFTLLNKPLHPAELLARLAEIFPQVSFAAKVPWEIREGRQQTKLRLIPGGRPFLISNA